MWIEIARILQASYSKISSHFGLDAIGDYDVIISELRQIADIGSSFVGHSLLDMDSLKVVDDVGLCLNNFHVVTKLWADAFAPSGNLESCLTQTKNCKNFENCPLEKFFYVQLSDGEKFDPPFSKEHLWYVEGEASQFTWSKHARSFPFESQFCAYMPVVKFVQTWVAEKGFEGWISLEIFDRPMREESNQPEANALRGIKSWKKLLRSVPRLLKSKLYISISIFTSQIR
ncbi:hypothetical protein N7495_007193 [Penicillium taxi]|uniref:uncharacterized protein n=1 Tax=Penicillium taxi TaxID=168475 RepID=UPI002545AAAD|nr:uncharacterized protein N7495_007193 [Penicillium taxi]KAJ5895502.1 hypothetical protein N7495_007193 [Penicillium taxi]